MSLLHIAGDMKRGTSVGAGRAHFRESKKNDGKTMG